MTAEIDYRLLGNTETSAIFGARTELGVNDYLMSWSTLSARRVFYAYGSTTISSTQYVSNYQRHSRKMAPDGGYYDGEKIFSWEPQEFETENNCWIFGRSGASSYASASVWSCRIWLGDVLTRNFLPALRKADGKPGMYDTITGVLYTNAGTGEFGYTNTDGTIIDPVSGT